MRIIKIGNKQKGVKYDFRETCFGIVFKDNEYYVTKKGDDISLIGGGIEENESHQDTLKREFIEEAGLTIKNIREFITIDCYWVTKNNKHMNSLSNIYIVEIEDEIEEPTEKDSSLIILEERELLNELLLPYQKEALKLFMINR